MSRRSKLPVRSKSSLDSNTLGLPSQRARSSVRTFSCERGRSRTPLVLQVPDTGCSSASGRKSRFKSPSGVETHPSQDPKWQKSQVKRIAEFMNSVDNFNNMVYTNPTTIHTFVSVVSTMLHHIDPRFKVDANNYKIKVPEYLSMLRYTGKCSANVMKTVYAQYSYPSVVGIWYFLMEQVTRKQSLEGIKGTLLLKFPEMEKHCEAIVRHSLEAYSMFQKGNSHDEVLEDYNQEINCLNGTDMIDVEYNRLSKEYKADRAVVIDKEKQYNEMLATVEGINARIFEKQQNMDSFKKRIKDSEKIYNEQIQKLQSSNINLESAIEIEEAALSNLDMKIAEIGHTQEEVLQLSAEINAKNHTLKLRAENKDHYMEQISNFDAKLTELKNKIETLVFCINNSLQDCICVFKDVRDHFAPESGFKSLSYLETIKTKILKNNLAAILSQLEKKFEEENLERLNTEGKLHESEAEKRMQLESLKREYEDAVSQKHVINENNKKLLAAKLETQSLQIELQKLQEERIDFKEFKNLRDKAEKRYTYLQILEHNRRTGIQKFIKKVHRMLMAASCEILKLLHNGCKHQADMVIEIKNHVSKCEDSLKPISEFLDALTLDNSS